MRLAGRGTGWAIGWVAVLCVGCTATPGPRACTEIGSPAGVAVTVDRGVATAGARLELRLCQETCVERRVDLRPGAVTVDQTCSSGEPDGSCSASSSPDGTLVGFVDLPQLSAGPVRVSGVLTTAGGGSTLAEITVVADPTRPNGPDCPVGGPQASVRVTAGGLR